MSDDSGTPNGGEGLAQPAVQPLDQFTSDPPRTQTVPSSSPSPSLSTIIYPTVRPIPHTVLTTNPSFEKTQLRIIDTPGLELGEEDRLHEKERGRGLVGLMRMLEERFALALREESRVIRRKAGGEDDLVHLG
jgi:hypothetical protein